MLQTLPPIRLLNLRLTRVPRNTQNLVIILRLTPLQRRLGLFQLTAERTHVRVGPLASGTLYGGFEIRDGGFEVLEMKVYSCACAEGFEGVW